MPLRVNFNYESMNAQRNLGATQNGYFRAVQQLSSGLRINKSADDAAGLAVSEKLKNQVRGLNQAQRNAQDGISLLQTAEGALNETHAILSRMRELAVQSANETLTHSDRDHIQNEVNSLVSEIDRIAKSTQFNKINLLDGNNAISGATLPGNGSALTLHIGANMEDTTVAGATGANELNFGIQTSNASSLGNVTAGGVSTAINGFTATYANGCEIVATLSVTGSQGTFANLAIGVLDGAIDVVSVTRGKLGALQNRLEHTSSQLGVISENTAAANSRIRDADVAKAVSEMVRTQILQQAAMSVLAQANQGPQAALSLLR